MKRRLYHSIELNCIPLKLNKIPQDDDIQADEGANNKPVTMTNWMAATGLQITAPVLSRLGYGLL